MQVDNFQIFTNVAMTADRQSLPIDANQYGLVDIQAVWTGSPVGMLFIETSNDVGSTDTSGVVTGVTNWTTYSGSVLATSGVAGNFAWHIWATGFKWARLSYTFISGSGTLNARVNQKG
jgi:hypothetical protein